MIDDFIAIGKITSTFGLKGLLKVSSFGDILSSLHINSKIYIHFKDELNVYLLQQLRKDKNSCIISLGGVSSIEEAENLIGKTLYFPKKETTSLLNEGEFFTHQLIGLKPYYNDHTYQGFKIVEVLENPVHPILLFSNNVNEILIPYINRFVGKVDLENSKIEILNWEEWIDAD